MPVNPLALASAAGWVIPLLSGVLLGAGPLRAQERGPLVFVLAGQSNMVGQGLTAELPAGLRVPPARVRFFVDSEETRLADGERFGPEIGLAIELSRALPDRDLVLVKRAVGGTSLLAWAPDWDSTRAAVTENAGAGPLYARLARDLERVARAADVEFGGVFWMQGERDARYPEAGREYFENLRVLIDRFRSDLGDPTLPFVLGLANPPFERYPALDAVRHAQTRAAMEIADVHLVDTAGLPKRADGVHYDSTGVLELGRRFAAAWLTAVRR